MKRKIRFKENVTTGGKEYKVTETEVEVRNLAHFDAQLNIKAHTFKPKKGKGSFTRKQKHKSREEY